MERRKLFSSTPTPTRRKLFSSNDGTELKKVMCQDCGYVMETTASTTGLLCPKCGSTRFNVLSVNPSQSNVPEAVRVEKDKIDIVTGRKPLFEEDFQKEFSTPANDVEKNFKTFTGKEVNSSDCQKLFSMTSDELIEKGFADKEVDGKVLISKSAYSNSKLFSKLTVTITKEFDLDPTIMSPECNKENIIENLKDRDVLAPKSIVLIKKAHSISPVDSMFSNIEESEAWLKDSGIQGDLSLEFGGKVLGIKEFMNLLDERYEDAPENIIDLLVSKGIIKIQGNQVEILN